MEIPVDDTCSTTTDPQHAYSTRLAEIQQDLSAATSRLNKLIRGLVAAGCACVLLAISSSRLGSFPVGSTACVVAAAVLIAR